MQLHHLAFRSDNIDALAAFYTELFGWRLLRDLRPRSLWLEIGPDAVAMLESREPGEIPLAEASLELLAFRVSPSEREQFLARARKLGCFDGLTEHTVYVRDPEGRRLAVSTHPLTAGD